MDADLRPMRADTSLGELVREATEQTSSLLRSEVALAKAELREDVHQAVAGISLFSAAGVAAGLSVLMLLTAAAFGIGRALGEGWTWAGFAIVGVVLLLVAAAAGLMGRRKADQATPPLSRTTTQVQKDVEAAKAVRS